MVRYSGGGRRSGGRTGSVDGSQGRSFSSANTSCRRHRGTNLDLFGRPVVVPLTCRVDVDSAHILDHVAKSTIHVICLIHLPTDCMRFSQYAQKDASFIEIMLRKFHIYFRYEDDISQPVDDSVIIAYIAKNYIDWLYEMRQRSVWAVVDHPKTMIRDHQSQIISDASWEAMCTYWDADDFKKKSEQMKNRSQLRVVHTTGSQSFEELKSVMRASLGRPPTMVEFWDMAYTLKNYTMSPASLVIRDQF